MMNMVAYVRAYHDSFAQRPLTEVDSLVLSELAYLHYESCGLADDPMRRMSLQKLAEQEHGGALYEHIFSKRQLHEMVKAIASSQRFCQLIASHHVCVVDDALNKQFSATTYLLGDETLYVAFRGTDTSVAGWKENLDMAYMPVVPSQTAAVAYLATVAREYAGSIYVGGHSKGGNLAVYAAACCDPIVQARILAVYNHDGPGFHREFFQQEGYRRIRERVSRTVPEESVVGLLLNHDVPCKVVDSKEHGVLQHSAMSWVIHDGRFVTKDSVGSDALAFAECVNTWVDTLNTQERKAIVGVLIQIISASNPIVLYEIFHSIVRKTPIDARNLSQIAPEDRQLLVEKGKELGKMLVGARK